MHIRALWGLFLLIGLLSAFKLSSPPREERKQLAGPPSEFASMAIPSPERAALRADSAIKPFTLSPSRNGQTWTWDGSYPVDTRARWTISIASPFEEYIEIYLATPDSSDYFQLVDSMFNTPDSIAKKSSGPFGIDGNTVPTTSYTFYDPPRGTWSIILNSTHTINQKPGLPHGYLILDNESDYKLVSHLNSYELEEGQELGLVVRMYEETPETIAAEEDLGAPLPAPLTGVISVAEMQVILPDGNLIEVPMHDDGQHYDLGADDGIYGATIAASTPGQYTFTAVISGTSPIGPFERTTKHLIQVTPPKMTLTGLAYSTFSKSTNVMSFYLDVDVTSALLNDADAEANVIAYAEVWGSVQNDLEYVPVAWVQAIVDPEPHDELGLALRLDLNADWIKLAGAYPPFQLRGVTLQDVNTNGVLSQRKEIFVQPDTSVSSLGATLNRLYTQNPQIAITEEMKWGPRPKQLIRAANETSVGDGGALLLVHGYCSGPVWPPADFTNALVFEDFTKSRTQDEFAKLILDFGTKHALSSYSIVGHSQGGLAALHLKTYYWSGLDTATGGKLIQSVGSPYLGCSLAGSLADIGSVFGVGCSSNKDLAPDGAALWASKIPNDMRKFVYFYLTQYDDKTWLGSACVTGSSMVMYAPNDGTSEKKYAVLSGANSMGEKKGWCHTSDMNYPPQCQDASRNKDMNSAAAR